VFSHNSTIREGTYLVRPLFVHDESATTAVNLSKKPALASTDFQKGDASPCSPGTGRGDALLRSYPSQGSPTAQSLLTTPTALWDMPPTDWQGNWLGRQDSWRAAREGHATQRMSKCI